MSNLLEDIKEEDEIKVYQDDIVKIKEISSTSNLPVVTYEVPSLENWEKLRYTVMDYLERHGLFQTKKFEPVYIFLRQHTILETQKEWVEFFTMLLSIPDLDSFNLWNQIDEFFVCS